MSFGDAVVQMEEQHGQEVDRTRAERVTYAVGDDAVLYLEEQRAKVLATAAEEGRKKGGVETLVLTADGGAIPVGKLTRPVPEEATEFTPKRGLPKGTREQTGREARLIVAHPKDCVTEKVFDIHIAPHNHPEVSGERMLAVALLAGWDENTHIHGVFDMGTWIRTQFQEQFPNPAKRSAAADCYHTFEYVGGAAKVVAHAPAEQEWWRSLQKARLLKSQWPNTVAELEGHQCQPTCPKDEHGTCLAQVALRYLRNHHEYLDYARWLAEGLPIGSGEAEGGIRHYVRKRLDVPGAWVEANAKRVMALITIRACGWWNDFWEWRDRRDRVRFQERCAGQHRSRFRGTPRHQLKESRATA